MGWRTGVIALVLIALGAGALYAAPPAEPALTPPTGTSNINDSPMPQSGSFTLRAPAFEEGGAIPARYTCDGAGTAPALEWEGAPERTQSYVLIMEDPDVPKELGGGPFVHWIVYGIPLSARSIPEGELVGTVGQNSAGSSGYVGPCPPREYEPSEHRYVFTLYALDIGASNFVVQPNKSAVMSMMAGHILAQATYTGRYRRP